MKILAKYFLGFSKLLPTIITSLPSLNFASVAGRAASSVVGHPIHQLPTSPASSPSNPTTLLRSWPRAVLGVALRTHPQAASQEPPTIPTITITTSITTATATATMSLTAPPEAVYPDIVLQLRANKEVRDSYGETALHIAAARGTVMAVGLLLDAGADTEAAIPVTKYTALH